MTNLNYEQIYGNDNLIIRIWVNWMVSSLSKSWLCQSYFLFLNLLQPPPSSTRPHVIAYNVSFNVSGTVQMYQTTHTVFGMEGAPPSLFVFTVVAVNILGAGEESYITSESCGVSL